MVKRMIQAYLARQTGLKLTLHAVLIVVESGDGGGETSWRNFSPSEIRDVFACTSTTSSRMVKWSVQADSPH
jgi:hypothetical protein